MKRITLLSVVLVFVFSFAQQINAQNAEVSKKVKYEVLKLKTSANDVSSESKIKKAVLGKKGIVSIDSKAKGKILVIKYLPNKTNKKELRKAIKEAGFTTEVIATNRGSKGQGCCKSKKKDCDKSRKKDCDKDK